MYTIYNIIYCLCYVIIGTVMFKLLADFNKGAKDKDDNQVKRLSLAHKIVLVLLIAGTSYAAVVCDNMRSAYRKEHTEKVVISHFEKVKSSKLGYSLFFMGNDPALIFNQNIYIQTLYMYVRTNSQQEIKLQVGKQESFQPEGFEVTNPYKVGDTLLLFKGRVRKL